MIMIIMIFVFLGSLLYFISNEAIYVINAQRATVAVMIELFSLNNNANPKKRITQKTFFADTYNN